jgi:hypothetical protein
LNGPEVKTLLFVPKVNFFCGFSTPGIFFSPRAQGKSPECIPRLTNGAATHCVIGLAHAHRFHNLLGFPSWNVFHWGAYPRAEFSFFRALRARKKTARFARLRIVDDNAVTDSAAPDINQINPDNSDISSLCRRSTSRTTRFPFDAAPLEMETGHPAAPAFF